MNTQLQQIAAQLPEGSAFVIVFDASDGVSCMTNSFGINPDKLKA